jgi:hypothetical protein
MKLERVRATTLVALAPLAVGAVLLVSPLPAAAAPAAQTAPATKDECKNGGWQRFLDPVFKNQGDCVSYVNRLGGGVPAVNPAATPELGSLLLYGSGAAGIAGYAWTRLRAGRGGRTSARPGAAGR